MAVARAAILFAVLTLAVFSSTGHALMASLQGDVIQPQVNASVTLNCHAYLASNWSDIAPVANVSWTQDGMSLGVTETTKINVTSDTDGSVNFTCTVTDDAGNTAIAMTTVTFIAPNLTECGEYLWGDNGTFHSGLNGTDTNNTNCAWIITTDPDKILKVFFPTFHLEEHASCSYNFLQIHDGPSLDSPMIGRYCGSNPLNDSIIISSTGNHLYFWFKMHFSVADNHFQAYWTAIDPDELMATLFADVWNPEVNSSVTLTCHAYLGYDWWSVASVANVTWAQDGVLMVVTEDTNINVTSDTPGDVNFTCTVTDDEGNSATSMTIVTFTEPKEDDGCPPDLSGLTGSYISHENSTYDNGMNCTWVLTTDPDKILRVTFPSFYLEYHSTCIYDFVQIHDGPSLSSPFIGQYCGILHGAIIINSTSNQLFFWLKTDSSVAYSGFQMDWISFDKGHALMASLQGNVIQPQVNASVTLNCHAYLTSNWSDIAPVANVSWTQDGMSLGVTETTKINVTSDTDGSVNFTCTVTDDAGNTAIAMTTVTFIAPNDTGCPPDLSGLTGSYISHENSTYDNGMNCTWVLTTDPDKILRVTFPSFYLESHSTCNYDFVQIHDGPSLSSPFIGQYCGLLHGAIIINSTSNQLFFWLKTDSSVAYSGFQMDWISFGTEGPMAHLYSSASNPQVNSAVTLNCYAYKAGNWSDTASVANVTWTQNGISLGVTEDTKINVTSDAPGDVNFTCTVMDDEGNTATSTATMTFMAVPQFVADYTLSASLGNGAYEPVVTFNITFTCHAYKDGNWTDAASVAYVTWSRDGEVLEVTEDTKNNLTSETPGSVNFTCTVTDTNGVTATSSMIKKFIGPNETACVEYLSGESGIITPQGNSTSYPNNMNCIWVVTTDPGKILMVDFSFFDVETHSSCSYDFLQINDGPSFSSPLIGRYCGNSIPNGGDGINSTSNQLYFWFKSDHIVPANGFQLNWNAYEGPEVVATLYPDGSEPYFVNTSLTLVCHAYVPMNWSDVANVANVSWTQNGVALGVTEGTKINVIADTPGSVDFACTVTDDEGNTATATRTVSFKLNETNECSEYLFGLSGSFLSQENATYGNNMNCTWVITTHPDKILSITFPYFYLESPCYYDALRIHDGPTQDFPLIGEYCGQSLPNGGASINSTSNQLFFLFKTDSSVGYAGFQVNWTSYGVEPLTANLYSSAVETPVNSTVLLNCYAYKAENWSDTASVANVTWTQNGVSFAVTEDTKINVTSGASGDVTYSCFVMDDDDNTATSLITVTFIPPNVQAHLSANISGVVYAGSTVEVQCWPYLGQAPFILNWTIDGIDQVGYTDNYFYLTSSTEANVAVSCRVTDGLNTNASASFFISFMKSPCVAGQGYSWVQDQCTACDGSNEYNDGSRQVCAYCRYNTGRPDACLSTDGEKTSTIARKDVCISAVLWSETCNAASVSLTDVNTMLSTDARVYFLAMFGSSSGLCANAACENIRVSVARRTHLCQALSCNSSSSACDNYSYKTTVSACLYDVQEFVDTGVDSVYRRPEEMFLESLAEQDTFPSSSNQSTTFADDLQLVLPVTRVDKTSIAENENRVLVATFHTSLAWSSNYLSLTSSEYITLNSNIQNQLPPMFGQSSDLLFVTITSTQQYSYGGSDLLRLDINFVFRRAIDSSLVQAVAQIGVRAHNISGGEFGTTGFNFQSEIHLFSSEADKVAGNGSVSWCSYLETLSFSIPLSYCEGNYECHDTDLWFECQPVNDTASQQRDLYPYGIAEGDSVLENSTQDGWYWYYHYISDKITFSTGAPFGTRRMHFAHVLPNGVITFGSPHRAWWPSFYYAQWYREQNILAPFWHSVDWRKSGKVYYQLYEKPNGLAGVSSVDTWSAVLDRAETEVAETLGVTDFDATAALVATWVRVQPYTWWSWVCNNYDRYKNETWWIRWYQGYYEEYCLNQLDPEVNTFQCVYVTDGQDAYAIVTYKAGEMRWRYDRWRSIEVGFTNPSETRDFGFRYTDLTTTLDTNTFNTGRYGTWIEKVGEYESTDAQCFDFFIQNLYMFFNETHDALLDNLYKCPCNMERLGFQWTWYGWTEVSGFSSRTYRACYILGRKSSDPRIRDNPHNKMCCYYYSYPTEWTWSAFRQARRDAYYIHYNDLNAGHVLKHEPYRPWSWNLYNDARLSKLEDFDPKNWCCRDSSVPSFFCFLFDLVRPDMGCSNDVDWFLGRAMGDPHIVTLDSKQYTFNGKGEYTLMQVTSIDFTLQARTDQLTNSEGDLIPATVFVAFAAREDNVTFQVELNENRTEMILKANGQDISSAFNGNSSYIFESNDMTVQRQDRNTSVAVTAAFPSNIGLEVFIGTNNLEFTVTVPTSYKGETSGLMGNYNDDNTDEFILPNGTALTSDQVDTERKVFENFGREWEVKSSSSVFQYAAGESSQTYQFPNFEPLFREEANQTLLQQAEDTCGVGEDACIFDLLATGDQSFAEATKSSDQDNADLVQSLGNSLPVLNLTTQLNAQSRWQLTHNEQATLQFSATDADGDAVGFELVEAVAGVSLDNETGLLTFTPNYSNPVVISVRASDGKGKSSTLSVNLVVCTGCSGNGTCDWSNTREPEYENGKFLISACTCWPAYTGDDCGEDVDGCADDPCGEGLNCTDISAADQGNQTLGYTCGDCAAGYTRDGDECIDTNECIDNGTSPVCPDNADCENTIGSYSCSCSSGYRTDPSDDTQCQDIDECAEQTHDCDQVCENQPGNFSCSCYGGNTLNQDGKTCTSNGVSCSASCAHFCQQNDDGSTECNCRTGYELADDGATCNDVDECDGKSPCSHECTNSDGSYTCSCFAGYELSEDSVSCTECSASYWGVNCASQCQCNGHGTCDRTRGCVCDEGWSGTRCVTDVDECAQDQTCPVGQECTNTLGSYRCVCPSGYSMNGDQCEDVDECADVLLHDCDLSTQDCANNVGSYSCNCRDGYARNSENQCADINECTQQSHSCEQVCENTEGSYNCDCYLGYSLNNDRETCVLRSDPCEGNSNLNCSQICTVNTDTNTAYCLCNAGYGLVGTEDCQDIDECAYDNLNLCSYKLGCSNTLGGFDCSCTVGTYLDRDGRTCLACGSGTWGDNCANSCQCDSDGASTCDAEIGCVCNTGFRGTYCEEDVDECTSGALTCEEGERCVNTRGSAHCDCLDGYSMVLGTCTDIDECAIITNNDCEQICVNFAGGYRCTCNAGYEMGDNCTDIDECTRGLDGCEQDCENTDGSYRCTCLDGLTLDRDGLSCVVSSNCTVRTDCQDRCAVINGTETCICPRGSEVGNDGASCIDIDLCSTAQCDEHCVENDNGTSIICSCDAGKALADDGFSCTECVEGRYGVECAEECDCNPFSTETCNKVNGSCTCLSGWEGTDCAQDIDECTLNTHNCTNKADSSCENTPGSFVCKCDDGYFTQNGLCSPCDAFKYGDECVSTCDCDREHSTGCDSTTAVCACESGWTGTRCDTDVDECAVANNCTSYNRTNWVCENMPGSYVCQCEGGYQDINEECVDIDECAADFSNLCNQNCSNTVGNYTCSCNAGYLLGADGRTCEDEDECATGSHGCEDNCANSAGSYTCSCGSNRELDNDNRSCYDAYSSASTVTLTNLDSSSLNLDDHNGADYLNTVAQVEPQLLSHVSQYASGVTKTTITDLRLGSVIVDFTTVINTETTTNAESQLTDALIALATNGITINGTHTSAQVVVGNLTVTSSTDKCEIMAALSACQSGQTCLISESGSAYCGTSSSSSEDDDDDDDIPLIVGLSVGLPLGLIAIAATGAAVWYKKKYKGQKRVNDLNDKYNDDDDSDLRSSSPDTLKNFLVDLPPKPGLVIPEES